MLNSLQDSFEIRLYEVFAFLGIIQCVFILVYIASRSWRSSRSIIPFIYFMMLGGLFYLEFATSFFQNQNAVLASIITVLWLTLPLLSYLLITQIIDLERLPSIKHYWVVFAGVSSICVCYYWIDFTSACDGRIVNCDIFYAALKTLLVIVSSIAVTGLLLDPNGFRSIRLDKVKSDRYWLALTIIFINAAVIGAILSDIAEMITSEDRRYILIILGCAYAYLATTSLFRIYPPSIPVDKIANPESLNDYEKKVVEDIKRLMMMDKLYQEAAFSRADMARELNISEGVITKVINAHYGKTFPTLINEARVMEAKHLLVDTDVNIKTIAEDVGFNSIATFNRVFKDIVGVTATEFRLRPEEKFNAET